MITIRWRTRGRTGPSLSVHIDIFELSDRQVLPETVYKLAHSRLRNHSLDDAQAEALTW